MNITYWKGWWGSLWFTYLKAMLVDNKWKRALFGCNVSGFTKITQRRKGCCPSWIFFPRYMVTLSEFSSWWSLFPKSTKFFFVEKENYKVREFWRGTRPNFTLRGVSIELSMISWVHDKRVESCAILMVFTMRFSP